MRVETEVDRPLAVEDHPLHALVRCLPMTDEEAAGPWTDAEVHLRMLDDVLATIEVGMTVSGTTGFEMTEVHHEDETIDHKFVHHRNERGILQ